jgi:hypothetical protein
MRIISISTEIISTTGAATKIGNITVITGGESHTGIMQRASALDSLQRGLGNPDSPGGTQEVVPAGRTFNRGDPKQVVWASRAANREISNRVVLAGRTFNRGNLKRVVWDNRAANRDNFNRVGVAGVPTAAPEAEVKTPLAAQAMGVVRGWRVNEARPAAVRVTQVVDRAVAGDRGVEVEEAVAEVAEDAGVEDAGAVVVAGNE